MYSILYVIFHSIETEKITYIYNTAKHSYSALTYLLLYFTIFIQNSAGIIIDVRMFSIEPVKKTNVPSGLDPFYTRLIYFIYIEFHFWEAVPLVLGRQFQRAIQLIMQIFKVSLIIVEITSTAMAIIVEIAVQNCQFTIIEMTSFKFL